MRLSCFSRINTPQIVISLWLTSKVLKRFTLTIFGSVVVVLMEEWIFGGPYSAVSKVLPPGKYFQRVLFDPSVEDRILNHVSRLEPKHIPTSQISIY